MSHLLIDAGNTRLKWRVVEASGAPAEGVGCPGDADLFSGIAPGAVDRISISTVTSEVARQALHQELASRFGVTPAFYWAQAEQCGVRCAYQHPETMGADRWHAMIGAWTECRQPLLVVDAGSALTLDLLDAHGQHLGGYILPGHRLMRESLEDKTARVFFGKSLSLDTSPGLSTGECVRHGLSWLWSSVIDRIEAMRTTYGFETVFVTGGDGEDLIRLGLEGQWRPSLVLDGLGIVVHREATE
ncbi:type III pantothenate kinase [Marinobacter halodurans]|uniref:Type III pantothenate kinase n=1 Tax=Marinobacter halodurans TaxID=2528979 RepID=A0ABY1ZFJ9_9GAMM|nr:type III pantothenate kinase [Marinobacter halodurans]TBW47511.1 type III pantothenate kinase [Marinobacter halodurans]